MTKSNEIWIPVKGYEGYYFVSNLGQIKSADRTITRIDGNPQHFRSRILRQAVNSSGYCVVQLCINGLCKTRMVHHIVASAFLNYDSTSGLVVNHINHNKMNNSVENLDVVTHRYNSSCHRYLQGKTSKYAGVHFDKRKKKWMAQIQICGKRKFLGYYDTEKEAANVYQKAIPNSTSD